MRLLSHRGYWREKPEQNTIAAFHRALDLGFGIETDLRDHDGEIVIAHDPPVGEVLNFRDFLELYTKLGSRAPLALNIKADGLAGSVKRMLVEAGVESSCFAFDMSVPDARAYAAASVRYFARQSELEPVPSLHEGAAGVWLDQFSSCWYGPDEILQHTGAGKEVALVSSELHGRPRRDFWETLSHWRTTTPLGDAWGGLMLCTDFPEDAQTCFGQGAG